MDQSFQAAFRAGMERRYLSVRDDVMPADSQNRFHVVLGSIRCLGPRVGTEEAAGLAVLRVELQGEVQTFRACDDKTRISIQVGQDALRTCLDQRVDALRLAEDEVVRPLEERLLVRACSRSQVSSHEVPGGVEHLSDKALNRECPPAGPRPLRADARQALRHQADSSSCFDHAEDGSKTSATRRIE